MNIEKAEVNGNVKILYSPNYGAGWSTWIGEELQEFALFDAGLVTLAEAGMKESVVKKYLKEKIGDKYMCTQGWRDIKIKEVPKGHQFEVTQNDGHETVTVYGLPERWIA